MGTRYASLVVHSSVMAAVGAPATMKAASILPSFSASVLSAVSSCHVQDDAFLTEDDTKYGGIKPRRNYLGPVYRNGFSDHLPLVCRLAF